MSASGYDAWRELPECRRVKANHALLENIRLMHAHSSSFDAPDAQLPDHATQQLMACLPHAHKAHAILEQGMIRRRKRKIGRPD
jgi:hypothetical protein